MSAHAPGPWHLSRTDGEITSVIQTSHLTRDVWIIPRNDADWYLIAAAPDLFEALKALLEEVERERDYEHWQGVIDPARAAIAKVDYRG